MSVWTLDCHWTYGFDMLFPWTLAIRIHFFNDWNINLDHACGAYSAWYSHNSISNTLLILLLLGMCFFFSTHPCLFQSITSTKVQTATISKICIKARKELETAYGRWGIAQRWGWGVCALRVLLLQMLWLKTVTLCFAAETTLSESSSCWASTRGPQWEPGRNHNFKVDSRIQE